MRINFTVTDGDADDEHEDSSDRRPRLRPEDYRNLDWLDIDIEDPGELVSCGLWLVAFDFWLLAPHSSPRNAWAWEVMSGFADELEATSCAATA